MRAGRGVSNLTRMPSIETEPICAPIPPCACFRSRWRFVGSDWQACHEEASLMALAVDFALVMLGGQVDGHREFRLALQDLCRMRCSRDRVAHVRERSGEEGMMGVVRPRDPRKRLGGLGIFLGAIAGAP